MADDPPAKRPRMQADTDSDIIRGPMWHKDGSIVLQAQLTQFRVHWSILSMHSSFFRDMEAIPQPLEQVRVEGCPLVQLSDSALDVQYLLEALYDPHFDSQKALPFSVVAGIVRLGRKYDFQTLLDAAVARLTSDYSMSLEEECDYDDKGPKNPRIVPYSGLAFDVITLCRENNIYTALPCAYYSALRGYTQTQIFDGVPRPDGTTASLSPSDQRTCILARQKLIRAQFEQGNTFGFLGVREPILFTGCEEPAGCTSIQSSWFYLLAFDAATNGVHALDSDVYNLTVFRAFCSNCARRASEATVNGRKNMWNSLPSFFDLPPWKDLKNDP